MRKTPKVSVVIPTYNRAHMLPRCIDAVLSQTLPDFEIIVVSDGSTDDTKDVVERYGDPRISFFEKENGGQASARNLGMQYSRGDYIAFCDDDDRIYADHLSTLSPVLDAREDIGLVYSDAVWVYPNASGSSKAAFSRDFNKKELENYNYITTQTILFRKTCIACKDGCVCFNEDPALRNGLEDWDFLLRLSDRFPFFHVKKVTAEYIVHEGNSFHSGSGYDYNQAFLFVRTRRFRHLIQRFGAALFHHVDHMYPFHLVQCLLDNGEYDTAVETSHRLLELHRAFTKTHEGDDITPLVLLFCLGISSYAAGHREDSKACFKAIRQSDRYEAHAPQFNQFIGEYVRKMTHKGLGDVLAGFFS